LRFSYFRYCLLPDATFLSPLPAVILRHACHAAIRELAIRDAAYVIADAVVLPYFIEVFYLSFDFFSRR